MAKCCMCQQINDDLTKIQNKRLEFLAQIVLKLKGFKDSLDVIMFAICKSCNNGLENFAIFWENIPEAQSVATINTNFPEDQGVLSNGEQGSPVGHSIADITDEGQYEYTPSPINIESSIKNIKLRIKPRRKRKMKDKSSAAIRDSLQKRVRRCPKIYDDFLLTSVNKNSQEPDNDDSLSNSCQVSSLRLNNGEDIGKLVEVKYNGGLFRMRIICQTCNQVFRSENSFQKHLMTHAYQSEVGAGRIYNYLFYCKLCDKVFTGHCAVRRHFHSVHSEARPFRCQHCEANFKYKFNLLYHMDKHIPRKRFECIVCKKMFLMRYELRIHLRTHTKEKPYKCEVCPLAFAHQSNLKVHKKLKHIKDGTNLNEMKSRINIEKKFKPPHILLEEETVLYDLKEKYVSDSENIPASEGVTNYSTNENIDNFSKTKSSLGNILELISDSKPSTSKEFSIRTESNASCKKNLKLQHEKEIFPFNLNDKNGSEIEPVEAVEDVTNDSRNGNNKINISEIENPLQNKSDNKLTYSNDKEILIQSDANESYKESVKLQPKIGTFKLDSSIIKILPTTSLLGLKKWPKSFQTNENICDVKNVQIIDNKFKATEISSNVQSENDMQSWKVIKVSSIPSKIKNNSNLKAFTNSATCNNTEYNETENKNKILHENVTGKSSTFLKTCVQQIESSGLTEVPNSSRSAFSEFTNTSKQSLLKPVLKPQEMSALAFKSSNILAAKPLITKLEILPPLDMQPILKKLNATTAPTELIKLPTDYKHQCPYCYKYFKQKSPLNKHLRTHTGEKPYKCNLCPKSYADASNYKKHKILHKNAADALNISRTANNVIQNSPAYSNVSDPDPDGIEVMQTLKKFDCSSEDEEEVDDASTSTIESDMWQDTLEHALKTDEIRENIKRHLLNFNNAILPKNMEHKTNSSEAYTNVITAQPDI